MLTETRREYAHWMQVVDIVARSNPQLGGMIGIANNDRAGAQVLEIFRQAVDEAPKRFPNLKVPPTGTCKLRVERQGSHITIMFEFSRLATAHEKEPE